MVDGPAADAVASVVAAAGAPLASCWAASNDGTMSCLQSGQLAATPCRVIHASMHSRRKTCLHGSTRSSSPSSYSERQIAHDSAASWFCSPPGSSGSLAAAAAAAAVGLALKRIVGSEASARATRRVSALASRSSCQKQTHMYHRYAAIA